VTFLKIYFVCFDDSLFNFGIDHVQVEVYSFLKWKEHISDRLQHEILIDQVHRRCKNCAYRLHNLSIRISYHHFGQLVSLLLDAFCELLKHPLIPLLALDISQGDAEYDDPTEVVYCGEEDVEQPVLVFAFAAAGD